MTIAGSTFDILTSPQAPQIQGQQQQYANYQQQLGALPAGVQQQDAYATAMAAIQQGQLGISSQQLGLQGLGEQYSTALGGIQRGISQYQQGLEEQQYGAKQQQALENYMYAQKNLQGQQAASGALGAPGQFRDTANLSQNFFTQANLAALGQKSEEAGYQGQQAQFAAQLGGQANTVGGNYNFGGGQAGIAQSNLALMAQANGLTEQQLVEQLNYGIAQNQQAGIGQAGQYLAQMGNLAAGQVSSLGASLAPVAYSGNINPIAGGLGF